MADFRQTSPSLQTNNSAFNFTPDTNTVVSSAVSSVGTGFSSWMTGLDNAEQRQYRARSAQLAEMSNARAEQQEARALAEYQYTQQERKVADITASAVNEELFANTMQVLANSGFDFNQIGLPLEQRTPEELQALQGAVEARRNILSIASGVGRGSQLADVRLLALQRTLIKQFPDMAAEFTEAFKTNTGKTAYERANQITEMAQHKEISDADATIKSIQTLREKFGLWGSDYTDEKVLAFARNFAERERRIDDFKNEAQIRRDRAAAARDALEIQGVTHLGDFLTRATQLGSGALANIELGGGIAGLSVERKLAFLQQVRQQGADIVAAAVQTGARGATLTPLTDYVDTQVKMIEQYLNGELSFKDVDNRLKTVNAFNEYTASMTPVDGNGMTAGELRAHFDLGREIAGPNSNFFNMQAETLSAPYLKQYLAGVGRSVVRGASLPGLGQGTLTGDSLRQGVGTAGIFAQYAFGGNPDLAVADPTTVNLGPGRSLSNVPAQFRSGINVTPAMQTRLNSLNTQLTNIVAHGSRTDARVMEPFLKNLADPTLVGTVHIDPETLQRAQEVIPLYYRKMLTNLNAELGEASEYNPLSRAESAFRFTNPFSDIGLGTGLNISGGQAAIGDAIEMVEARDGGVTFRVSSKVTDPEMRASAARAAQLYNNKYAPKMRMLVRAYAHTYQGDTDYHTALSEIMLGAQAAGDRTIGRQAYDRARATLLSENPDMNESAIDAILAPYKAFSR